MVKISQDNLWTLALERQWIAPGDLADAVQREAGLESLDFRTRLLIRDSLDALRQKWGQNRLAEWVAATGCGVVLNSILGDKLGAPGFPSLVHRLMEPTRSQSVLQFLRELGENLQTPVTIAIGRSIALILENLLSRRTEDIDLVNEIPAAVRSEHAVLDGLAKRYGLKLAHFQSHYLPMGWESRLIPLETMGRLTVRLVDGCDIFVGKLFSRRDKDRDDLRALAGQLEKARIIRRLGESAGALMGEKSLREQAEKNWYVLYGEQLPA
jgi:hypothetical protein